MPADRSDVPNHGIAVAATAGESFAVREEANGMDGPHVPGKGGEEPSGRLLVVAGDVPDFDETVLAGRRHEFAARRKIDRRNAFVIHVDFFHQVRIFGVPDHHLSVPACGGQEAAIVVVSQAVNRAAVPAFDIVERLLFLGGKFPKDDSSIRAGRGDPLAIG